MFDFLTTALVVFAILAGSVLGLAVIVTVGRGASEVALALYHDTRFRISCLVIVALLAFLIAT